jgi:hypothetical protein
MLHLILCLVLRCRCCLQVNFETVLANGLVMQPNVWRSKDG